MKPTALWIIWNLFFAYVFAGFLPENVFRFAITMWMPALSAFVFLKFEKIPIKAGINWHLGSAKSYALSLSYCVVVAITTVAIGFASGYLSFNADHGFGLTSAALTLVIWIVSSLGEEIGWRGYLHNHLKSWKHMPLLVGVVWGAWHFRDMLNNHLGAVELGRFTLLTILVSYFLSWLIENKGSVLTCAIFHGIWNFLRIKLLFGNPSQGTTGYFKSTARHLTEMEGVFGLLPVIALSIPILVLWYSSRVGGRVR